MMKTQNIVIAAALSLMACRVGGPTDDGDYPLDSGIGGGEDAGVDAGGGGVDSSVPGVDASSGGDSGGGNGGDGGGNGGDGSVKDSATTDAPVVTVDAGCSPPAPVTTCDPVCNTGCTGLVRCDITDNPHEGACIGIWIQGEGSFCIKTASTDPCAAQLACVDSKCVKLCYHDNDCAGSTAGPCCSGDVKVGSGQSSGFKQCGACGP